MISKDNLAVFALNGITAYGLYHLGAQRLPSANFATALGGMGLSTLFQVTHLNFSEQVKEKSGDKVFEVMAYVYPGVVALGGYFGGVTANVNLIATAIFASVQFIGTLLVTSYRDDQHETEITTLGKNASTAVDENRLEDAEQLINQMDTILANRNRLSGLGILQSPIDPNKSCLAKTQLAKAYFQQTPPNYAKGSQLVAEIQSPVLKGKVYLATGSCLIDNASQEDAKAFLEKYEALLDQLGNEKFTTAHCFGLKHQYGIKYNDEKVLLELARQVNALEPSEPSELSFGIIVDALKVRGPISKGAESMNAFDKEVIVACLNKGLESLDTNFTKSDAYHFLEHDIMISIEFASKIKKFDLAKRFANHPILTGEHRAEALLEIVREGTDLAEAHIAANKLEKNKYNVLIKIAEAALHMDVELFRDIKSEQADLKGESFSKSNESLGVELNDIADSVVSDLEKDFNDLSTREKLAVMKLQAEFETERVFEEFDKHKETWNKESLDFQHLALAILAKKHLEQGKLEKGKKLIEEMEQFLVRHPYPPKDDDAASILRFERLREMELSRWNQNCAELGRQLVGLRKTVRMMEPKSSSSWF